MPVGLAKEQIPEKRRPPLDNQVLFTESSGHRKLPPENLTEVVRQGLEIWEDYVSESHRKDSGRQWNAQLETKTTMYET